MSSNQNLSEMSEKMGMLSIMTTNPKLTTQFKAMVDASLSPEFHGSSTAIYSTKELMDFAKEMEDELNGIDFTLLYKLKFEGVDYVEI